MFHRDREFLPDEAGRIGNVRPAGIWQCFLRFVRVSGCAPAGKEPAARTVFLLTFRSLLRLCAAAVNVRNRKSEAPRAVQTISEDRIQG